MPRTNPVPPSELAIGQRLHEARKELLIPRTAFALKCGVSMNRIDTYENGRAVLPWSVGHEACRTFGINEIWLFNGTGQKFRGWIFSEEAIGLTTPRMSFSEVMERILKKRPEFQELASLDDPAEVATNEPHPNTDQKKAADSFTFGPLYKWLDAIAPGDTASFLAKLTTVGNRLAADFKKRRRAR